MLGFISLFVKAASEVYYLFLSVAGGNGSFPPKLTPAEERKHLLQMAMGDKNARAKLIEHKMRLVAHVIKKFNVPQNQIEDLISIGCIGLIKAVDGYKIEKGTKFSAFAARCIENECKMSFRAGKKTSGEVLMSDAIDTDKNGNELTYADLIYTDDTIIDDLDLKIKREKLVKIIAKVLDERETYIIYHRYGLGGYRPKTQIEIAEVLDISRSYVSRIEKKALETLLKNMK